MSCRSGRVGSAPEEAAPHIRTAFSEQDQTDLYNAAHSGKSQGRVGLGTSSQPKKIGGARWQGSKTRLDSDSEQDVADEQLDAAAAAQQQTGGSGADATAAEGADVLPGGTTITWGKGVRPQWFSAHHASQSAPAAQQSCGNGAAMAEAEPLIVLTSKQRKACTKATRRAVRAGGGSCKLRAVLDKATEALQANKAAHLLQAKTLRKCWKQFLNESEAWVVSGGSVSAAE